MTFSDFHIYNEVKYTSWISQKLWKVKDDTQARRSLQSNGKPSAEIKIEICIHYDKIWNSHYVHTFTLWNYKREKFGATREQNPL